MRTNHLENCLQKLLLFILSILKNNSSNKYMAEKCKREAHTQRERETMGEKERKKCTIHIVNNKIIQTINIYLNDLCMHSVKTV